MKRKKILEMLSSADEEMVRLGMITALNQGYDWCRDNIPAFGYPPKEGGMMTSGVPKAFGVRNDTLIILNKSVVNCMPFSASAKKMVSEGGFIDARPLKEAKSLQLEEYEIIEI